MNVVGNGTYESIPDTDNGDAPLSSSSSFNTRKWFIGSSLLIVLVGAIYGTTTFIHNKDKTTLTDGDAIVKAMKSKTNTLKVDSTGKLKLFDDMSKLLLE
jgi:hypothetical protein